MSMSLPTTSTKLEQSKPEQLETPSTRFIVIDSIISQKPNKIISPKNYAKYLAREDKAAADRLALQTQESKGRDDLESDSLRPQRFEGYHRDSEPTTYLAWGILGIFDERARFIRL